MTDEKSLRSYYMDIEHELAARKSFPNTSQNKKRIVQCERELSNLRDMMEREQ